MAKKEAKTDLWVYELLQEANIKLTFNLRTKYTTFVNAKFKTFVNPFLNISLSLYKQIIISQLI